MPEDLEEQVNKNKKDKEVSQKSECIFTVTSLPGESQKSARILTSHR